jgi:hypothetical protein
VPNPTLSVTFPGRAVLLVATMVLAIFHADLASRAIAQSSAPPSDSPGSDSASAQSVASTFSNAATVEPTASFISGTQDQTIWGGSALLSTTRAVNYCDPAMRQFGLNASASDSRTAKAASPATYIDSNDLKLSAVTGLGGHANGNSSWTHHFLAVDADWFGNNSLGIGLQQTYAAQYQFDFGCGSTKPNRKLFGSLGIGAGFISERLYKTPTNLNGAVLPLSGQVSYLIGGGKGKPPKLVWYGLIGYLPVLTNTNAYQFSAITSLQVPTGIRWLTINFTETDLYANNAPTGHKRNYQNGSVALVFSFPPKPAQPTEEKGACFAGDKLQRLYCYQDVSSDACAPPNIFRPRTRCSSAGVVPALTQ